ADDRVTLGWSGIPGVTGYDVKRSTHSGGPYASIATVFDANDTDDTAANGTTYYYVVAAMNALGDGTNSAEVSATPSPGASLKTWFKADAMAGVSNGAAISDWADWSGNGDDATQTNAARQPAYVTNAMNGLPAIRFNAADSNSLAFARPVQDDFTIFCVFRSTQGFGSGNLFYQGAGLVNGEVAGVTTDFGICLFSNGQICAGTGDPDVAVNSAPGFNDGQPHLVTFKRTESTGEADLYVDGAFMGSVFGGTGSLQAPARLVLGAQQTDINFLSGDIAEVKIYNTALSDAERSAEEGALECKYGIAGAGPAPAIPTGVTGTPGNRVISLSWLSSSGAAAYDVSSSTHPDGPFTPRAVNLAATSYLDTNAVSGETNYYTVTAANGCGVSASSAPVGVFLPKPALSVTATNPGTDSLTLGWPVWANDWELDFATNLTWPITWFPVTNAVGSNNEQFNTIIPINPGTRFFRLSAP
ncbi:MAG: hypothetical protein KGR98_14560, partial [Verrucomicrobia bacterium]|nr:hypothetical protein [Verrucomicrobiota bacterium]